ncbi:MAG: hypothetical protein KAW12_05645 [Candidatus Aminicenantes bacterium]|nr:hypothetical protein [Candidatus Aminicenantes bacterium]
MIKVIAKFVNKKTGEPVSGENYIVRLYDNDVVSDDFLGEGKLNNAGEVHILTDLSKASSFDSPGEKKPDLYFELYNEHGVVYQSKVFANVDFLEEDKVTGKKTGLTKDFGVFEI